MTASTYADRIGQITAPLDPEMASRALQVFEAVKGQPLAELVEQLVTAHSRWEKTGDGDYLVTRHIMETEIARRTGDLPESAN